MGSIGLGRSHGDFRSGMGVNGVIRFSCNGGANHIADGQGGGTGSLCQPQGGNGIGSLAALADKNAQGAVIYQRVPIAELGRHIHLGGNMGQVFKHGLGRQPRVHGGAAADNVNLVQILQLRRSEVQSVHLGGRTGGYTGADGFPYGRGLLVHFLEHKVRVAVFLRRGGIPVNALVLLLKGVQLFVIESDILSGDDCVLLVVQQVKILGVGENGRNVRGNVILLVPNADDQGAGFAHHNHLVGRFAAQHLNGIAALQPLARPLGSPQKALLCRSFVCKIVVGNQVGDHLGVCFAFEGAALQL